MSQKGGDDLLQHDQERLLVPVQGGGKITLPMTIIEELETQSVNI